MPEGKKKKVFVKGAQNFKDGHGIYVSECYRVFVKGAQNFDEAKEIWDNAALDDERCTVVKYYEDDVWD